MIPEARKKQAYWVVAACFALIAVGVVMGLVWVNLYTVR